MIKTMFFSPLEQFQVLPIVPITFGFIDLSLTNEVVILFLVFFLLGTLLFSLLYKDGTLSLIPNRWQAMLEMIYKAILSLVVDNIRNDTAERFFPLVFSVFFFILSLNVIGLVPYSFTITSHLIVTLAIALSIFIGINIICVRRHGMKFFSLFLPPGTGVAFAFLLVPIEFISYFFKPVSLSIRLFANMMAGHALLKVIISFAWTMTFLSGGVALVHIFPLIIIGFPLFFPVICLQSDIFLYIILASSSIHLRILAS